MYTEAIVAKLEVLSRNLPGETEKNHEPQAGLSRGRDLNSIPPKYEVGDPAVRQRRLFFFNLHSGGWNQGPLDTAAT
jgi:hypothetical protein